MGANGQRMVVHGGLEVVSPTFYYQLIDYSVMLSHISYVYILSLLLTYIYIYIYALFVHYSV
jgi:hypothetical protein